MLCFLVLFFYSADFPAYFSSNETLNTVDSIINTFFPAWLLGFIEAEGFVSVYKNKVDSFIASFTIAKQVVNL
jgi:hypothetical protein